MHLKAGLMFAACLLIAACGMQPMKPSPGHVEAAAPAPAGDIPEPVRVTPLLPKPKPAARPETYSVVVNNVKVQELLFALARDAKLNVDIHSGIVGSVTLNAVDQTLQQLLARIAKQVDMRYELDGPNLAVMPDTPYLRIYKIDYLNIQRDTDSKVGTSTQVATPGAAGAGGGGSGGGGGNQSTTSITNKSTNHFWDTLVKNVQDILHETDKLIPVSRQTAGTARPAAPATSPTLQVNVGSDVGATPKEDPITFREAASVISNPESGVLSIRASSRQHEKIQEFLDQVLSSAKRQVLIEATIVEVQLNNQYQRGIDWSAGRSGSTGFTFNQFASGTPLVTGPTAASPTGNTFVLGAAAPNYSNLLASVRLLESFGNVRVLSSPRLTVLNNQTAILKVVDNQVYFTIQATTTAGSAGVAPVTTFTTTPNVVAVGFIMNVTPQISDADSVLLNVRPSISRKVGDISDPNPSLGAIPSKIPIIRTREMESLIKVNSGQIAVMGGLIQDDVADVEDSVPGANRILGIGRLFENKNQTNTKTELVVFIRPIIIRDASIDGDYRGYRSYLPDDKFMAAPNPGKPPLLGDPPGTPR
ncbi:MAG: secretin N-terminal domain-containing protein [Pseudomonadota bacterium]